jgi:mRNA interferase RelE/StbE
MSYQILLLDRALDEFGRLPKKDYERVRDTMLKLAQEPRPPGCLSVVGRAGYHLRAGACRIIYEVDDTQQIVSVLRILGFRAN